MYDAIYHRRVLTSQKLEIDIHAPSGPFWQLETSIDHLRVWCPDILEKFIGEIIEMFKYFAVPQPGQKVQVCRSRNYSPDVVGSHHH